jgi:hypothetical protein
VRKTLAYFGLDGSATWQDWARAACEMLPPLVVTAVVVALVGVGGLAGWAIWLLVAVVAWVLWLPLLRRFAPWRRRS